MRPLGRAAARRSSRVLSALVLVAMSVLAILTTFRAAQASDNPIACVVAAGGGLLMVAGSSVVVWAGRSKGGLPLRTASAATVAAIAANSVAPAGAAGMWLLGRVHRRSGLDHAGVGAALALRALAGPVTMAVWAAVAVFGGYGIMGVLPFREVHLPRAAVEPRTLAVGTAAVLILLLVVGLLAVTTARGARAASRVHARARAGWRIARHAPADTWGHLRSVGGQRRRLVVLGLGYLAQAVGPLVGLTAACAATGHHIPLDAVAMALLGGGAARAAAPTPGGVGSVEAGMGAALMATGLGLGAAASAIALYRVASHWLPVAAGMLGWRRLSRAGIV